jgi:hypothetical protein
MKENPFLKLETLTVDQLANEPPSGLTPSHTDGTLLIKPISLTQTQRNSVALVRE